MRPLYYIHRLMDAGWGSIQSITARRWAGMINSCHSTADMHHLKRFIFHTQTNVLKNHMALLNHYSWLSHVISNWHNKFHCSSADTLFKYYSSYTVVQILTVVLLSQDHLLKSGATFLQHWGNCREGHCPWANDWHSTQCVIAIEGDKQLPKSGLVFKLS